MLNKHWCLSVSNTTKTLYQTVLDFTYWPALEIFNNRNIIRFTNKTTYNNDCDDINKVFYLMTLVTMWTIQYIQVSMVPSVQNIIQRQSIM